jgi:hypothetical protein
VLAAIRRLYYLECVQEAMHQALNQAQHGKVPSRIGEGPFFDVLHPGAVHSQRHLMFLFTGHTASVTPNILAVVNEKANFHGCSCPRFARVMRAARTQVWIKGPSTSGQGLSWFPSCASLQGHHTAA